MAGPRSVPCASPPWQMAHRDSNDRCPGVRSWPQTAIPDTATSRKTFLFIGWIRTEYTMTPGHAGRENNQYYTCGIIVNTRKGIPLVPPYIFPSICARSDAPDSGERRGNPRRRPGRHGGGDDARAPQLLRRGPQGERRDRDRGNAGGANVGEASDLLAAAVPRAWHHRAGDVARHARAEIFGECRAFGRRKSGSREEAGAVGSGLDDECPGCFLAAVFHRALQAGAAQADGPGELVRPGREGPDPLQPGGRTDSPRHFRAFPVSAGALERDSP